MVYSTRRFVLCLTLSYFVLVFFSPFSIAITLLGEKRINLNGSTIGVHLLWHTVELAMSTRLCLLIDFYVFAFVH